MPANAGAASSRPKRRSHPARHVAQKDKKTGHEGVAALQGKRQRTPVNIRPLLYEETDCAHPNRGGSAHLPPDKDMSSVRWRGIFLKEHVFTRVHFLKAGRRRGGRYPATPQAGGTVP